MSTNATGFPATSPPFAARKRPPLQPRDRNIEYSTPSSSPPMESPIAAAASHRTHTTADMLDTDDPFNTKKKSSTVSLDDLPIGGSRSAQSVAPAYYQPTDGDNYGSEREAVKRSLETAVDSGSISSARPASHRPSASAAPPPRPPVALRERMAQRGSTKQRGDRDEEKDSSGQTVAAADTPIRPTADSSGADDAPLPRSSAATLLALLDTDDPFNSKKKQSSFSMSDDAPLTGDRAAQSMQVRPGNGADETKEDSEQAAEEAVSPAAAPPKRRPPPTLRSRMKQQQQSQEQPDSSSVDSNNSTDGGAQSVDADEQPLFTRRSAAPLTATSTQQQSSAVDSQDVQSESSASAQFDDAPLPRSSAATLAAMLDTDDPFNSKKKSSAVALDDQPIGGSRAAQHMADAGWTDDSMNPASSAVEDASSVQHKQPPTATRRPPVRARAKATASAGPDGEQQLESSEASEMVAEDNSASSATPPRRPPIKAKQKVDKDKSAAAAATTAAEDKKKQGSAVTAATPHTVKFEAYKGDGVMEAEEADTDIAGVISSATLALIQSKKWTEAVEGLQALTTQAEQLGPDDFTPHLAALMSSLSRSPTFKPANFNVCRAVYDCYAACLQLYVQSQHTNFSTAFAYHPLPDVLSKLADAKVVDSACSLLSVMAECAGPRFMYNHVAANVTKESFKSVKAIEAALQFLSTMIEQFGVGSLDVLSLIDQCALWMQSTSKAVKDSTLNILLTVYKQTGSLFRDKMMLNLKPAAQKELEALMSAVPSDTVGKLTATKWRKGDSGPAAINVDALVPRVDISAQVNDKLMKKLNDDNWKERKEAMDELEAIIKQANVRIQPKDGGALEVLGKWRLVDKNKNLSRDALALLALFCQAMGKPIATFRDKLVPNLFLNLADSKKLVKDEAMRTVGVWVETAGLASVAKYLPKALSAAGSRKELLDVMAASMADDKKLRKEKKDMELDELIAPVIACMQDKTVEVRVAAERVAELLARQVGVDALNDELKNLKKAEVLALRPVLDKIKRALESSTDSTHAAATAQQPQRDDDADDRDSKAASGSNSSKRSTATASGKAASAVKSKAGASSGGTLKKGALESAMKTGDKAEAEPASSSSAGSHSSSSSELIKRSDMAAKSGRVKKDSKRVKGQFREWGSDEVEEMSERMRDLLADSFHAQLFHKDFAKQMLAIDAMEQLIAANLDSLISVLDLTLKWTSWRMCDANTAMLLKLLSFLTHLFTQLLAVGYTLHEGEANNVLPFVVEKVLGHNNAKFRQDSKDLLRLACRLYDDKGVFAQVVAGLDSKNKRVQSECIELAAEIILQYGMAVGDTKRVTLAIAMQVGASDAAVRAAALNALGQLYERYGETVYTLMGGRKDSKVPPKQMAMIDARLKTIKPSTSDEQHSTTSASASQLLQSAVAGKTPQKSSPPSSVAASPRLPPKQQTAGGVAAGRTPVRGASSSSGSIGAAVPSGAPSFDDDRSHAGDEDSSVSSADVNSSLSLPPSAAVHVGRKSFTANAISSDLPSCFSLDLDSNTHGSSTTQQHYDSANSASIASMGGPSSSYGSLSRPLSAFTAHSLSSTSAFSLRPSSSASSFAYSLPSSPQPSTAAINPAALPSSPLPTAVLCHSLSFNSPSAPADRVAAAGVPSSGSGMVASLSARLSMSGSEERIEVMKELWESIIASRASIVEGEVDDVVRFLCDQIEVSFAPLHDGSGYACSVLNHRYCRYALNTLMELFKLPALIAELSVGTLGRVSYLLLVRLMDERGKTNNAADAQSKQLMQAINVLVLKVMENSDRTAILHVLIQALTQVATAAVAADGSLVPRLLSDVDPLPAACFHPGFVDLLVRCLSKLIRTFQQTGMHDIDTDCLLRDIHHFLVLQQPSADGSALNAQPAPVTGTASTDQSVRAVRSVLAVLVSVRGDSLIADIAHILPADSPVLSFTERTIANWKAKSGASSMSGTQQVTPNYRSAAVAQAQQRHEQTHGQPAQSRAAAVAAEVECTSLPARSVVSNSGSVASSTSATRLSFGPRHAHPAPVGVAHGESSAASNASMQSHPVQQQLGGLSTSYSSLAALVDAVLSPSTAAGALSQLGSFQSCHPELDVQSAFVGQSAAVQSLVRRQLALSAPTVPSASSSQPSTHSSHRKQSALTDTSALRERLAALQTRARVTASMGSSEQPTQPAPPAHPTPYQPQPHPPRSQSHSRSVSGSSTSSSQRPLPSPAPPLALLVAADTEKRSQAAEPASRSSLPATATASTAPSSSVGLDHIKQRYLALRRHE